MRIIDTAVDITIFSKNLLTDSTNIRSILVAIKLFTPVIKAHFSLFVGLFRYLTCKNYSTWLELDNNPQLTYTQKNIQVLRIKVKRKFFRRLNKEDGQKTIFFFNEITSFSSFSLRTLSIQINQSYNEECKTQQLKLSQVKQRELHN